jgi:5-methylcytosine-specific restriction protein A
MSKHIRLRTLKPRLEKNNSNGVKLGSGSKRVKGSSWIAIKKWFQLHNPRICAECERQGLVGNGDELDHIIPLWSGGTNDADNLQWLCSSHHKEKTSLEQDARSTAVMKMS